jgi:hypothetical protein
MVDVDPAITMVFQALAAGAAAAAKDTATQVVKDAYAQLKELVRQRFAGKPTAEDALTQFEEDPDTWEKPLGKMLAEAGAGGDQELTQLAQRLLQVALTDQRARGKYNVQISDGKGILIGDHGHQENRFGSD